MTTGAATSQSRGKASRIARSQEAELAQLEQRGALGDADAWRRIELVLMRRGAAAALPDLRAWLNAHPADARAKFHAGQAAHELREVDAVTLLESAMTADPGYEPEALELIAAEFMRRGDDAGATAALERAAEAEKRRQDALSKRVKKIDPKRMKPHSLAPPELAALTSRLAEFRPSGCLHYPS